MSTITIRRTAHGGLVAAASLAGIVFVLVAVRLFVDAVIYLGSLALG